MTGLLCPLCDSPLGERGRSLVCGEGHSYDIAASGYCNLLRPGKLRNRVSGDDREMVSARKRFLAAGYYEPVLLYIAGEISRRMQAGLLIDAGCGEGYYTNGIACEVPGIGILGVDVSKYAADAASKGAARAGVSDRVRYIAASASELPVADGAASAVASLFAPCSYGEFARVTEDGGYLIIGSAGERHLYEMKEILYGGENVRLNVPIDHPALAEPFGYSVMSRENVAFTAEIAGRGHIAALFSMTPYRWRTSREGAERLLSLDALTVTVDVDVTVLKLKK